MTSPPSFDARNLIQKASRALGRADFLTGLPGVVHPLSRFFAAEVDPRRQIDKRILWMRPETAVAVWAWEHGKRGKSPGISSKVREIGIEAFLDEVEKVTCVADTASVESSVAEPPLPHGGDRVRREIDFLREAASKGKTDSIDESLLALFRAMAEHGRGLQCNEVAETFAALPRTSPLRLFFDDVSAITEKEHVINQAITMLEQVYAHLPAKRALYAIDPIQRLRLLKREIPQLPDSEFHGRMLDIFKDLQDAHTSYCLPPPFRGRYAFLPFLMEDCGPEGGRRFVVTSVIPEFYELIAAAYQREAGPGSCAGFGRGAEIIRWNGAPMERAVWRNAERESGSNSAARFARGVAKMTVRSLSHSLPPEEEWVTLSFLPPDGDFRSKSAREPREITIPWAVWQGERDDLLRHREETESSSVDMQLAEIHVMRKSLWARSKIATGERSNSAVRATDPAAPPANAAVSPAESDRDDAALVSRLPEFLELAYPEPAAPPSRSVERVLQEFGAASGKRIGYLRIRSFDAGAKFRPEVFFREVLRIVEEIMEPRAPDGLIIDVRGNSGGIIKNGERILQLFTPNRIEPARFHYRSTPLIRRVADNPPDAMGFERRQPLATVRESLDRILYGGGELSDGFPLTDPAEANDTGQRYYGPVALVIDAMCYSATDIFIAGFKDNGVAARKDERTDLIIGTDSNIGAGGACLWTHEDDLMLIGDPFVPLPPGYGMTVAIHRSSRSGRNSGLPLEDFGIAPGIVRPLTTRDILRGNEDLVRFACGLLAECPRFQVGFDLLGIAGRQKELRLVVRVRSQNLDRIECYVDGVLQRISAAPEGEIEVEAPLENPFPGEFEVRGFVKIRGESGYELKAASKRKLSTADRQPLDRERHAGAGQ